MSTKKKFAEDLPRLDIVNAKPTVNGGFMGFLSKITSPTPKEYEPIPLHEPSSDDIHLKRSTSAGENDPEFLHRINKHGIEKSQSMGSLSYSMLSVPEQLLITIISDQGSIRTSINDVEGLLLWGILCELVIAKKICTFELLRTPNNNSNNRTVRYGLDVINCEPTGNALFDEVLQKN